MTSPQRSWLKRVVLVLLAFEAIYLIAGNVFLNAAIGQELLARKPQKFQIQWESGWTVLPGFVQVRDLRLRTQTRSVQWYLRMDRVRGHFFLAPLLLRRFHLTGVQVVGVDFRLRRRLDFVPRDEAHSDTPRPSQVTVEGGDLLPEIPGLSNPPDPAPEEIYSPPPNPRGWILDFNNITADEIHNVWIEQAHYVPGEGRVGQFHGNLRSQLRGPLSMHDTGLTLAGGELRLGDNAIATAIDLAVDARFHRYTPRENRGTQALKFLSGTLDLQAQLSGANPIDFFFRNTPLLSITTDGPLNTRLVLDHGTLSEGTQIAIGPGEVAVRYLDYESDGTGTVVGGVTDDDDADMSWLEATLDTFAIRGKGLAKPHIRGEGFRFKASTADLNLAQRQPAVDVEIEMPESEIVDLSYYNAFLPPDSGLVLGKGTGSIQADLQFSTETASGSGSVDLQATGLDTRFGDLGLRGDFDLRGRFPQIDIPNRRFSLAGTELRLDHVVLADGASAEDWWLRLKMLDGQARLTRPLTLDTQIRATLRDSRPVVALLVEKKPLLRWIDGLLAVQDIQAEGRLRVSRGAIQLRDAELTGQGLELLADIGLRKKQRDGLLFLRKGKLSAAVELENGERDWKLTNSREWYQQRLAARND